MNPILRRFKKPVLIGVGAVAAVLAFAWLALPGIVQLQAESFIAEKTGHRLVMARPEINPLALSIRLRELRLADASGASLLAFDELFIDISAASLTERALVFDAIRLGGLNAKIIERKKGGLNWSPLLDALRGREPQPESNGMPRLDIRHLQVIGAQLEYADQRLTPAFNARIEPLDLELTDVSTLPDDTGKFKLIAKTLIGVQLAWEGSVTLNPIASKGHLSLSGIDLGRLAPLLKDTLPIAPPTGIATFAADYHLAHAGGALSLSLEQMRLSVSTLRLQKVVGDAAPQMVSDRIEIKDGRFDLGTRQLALGTIHLQGNRLEAALEKMPPAPVVTLDDIVLTDARIDLAQRNATLAALTIKGGGINARRDAQGKLDLLGVIDSLGDKSSPKVTSTAKTAAPEPAAPPPYWRFRIEHVALAGLGVIFRDEAVAPAAELALDNIAITVDGVSENFKAALPLRASLDARSGGRLEVAGTLTPVDAAAELQVKLSGLVLNVAQPYLSTVAALDLAGGQVAAEGRVIRNAKTSSYRGSVAVRDLRLNEAGTPNLLLAWKSLSSADLELSPTRLNMALLSLDGLDTKLIIDKDKATNLKRVMRQPAAVPDSVCPGFRCAGGQAPSSASTPAPQAAPVAATTSAGAEAPGFLVTIDRLRFRNGELYFADNSLLVPFGTRIHHLRGSIVGLSSRAGVPGQMELDGEVDEFGLARAAGQADFFNPTDFMDLTVVFRNVDMTHLSPYSTTFAGRNINSGKLSLELEYKIKQRQLQSENRIVIDRLELGERVESPTAKDLPLDLAIAVLTDSDGRIDLGVPISGSLDDPQFSYGRIVWQAIVNVLGKIVTAPFRALGALVGGGDKKIDHIAFEAGASSLTPPEREKLVHLATVLNKRPGLALNIYGTWGEVDRAALQDRQLRRAIAEKSGQVVGAKEDPGPLSTRVPKVQSALEALYADRVGSAELAALKEGFRNANPGQLEESATGKMMSRLAGLMRDQRSLSEAEVVQLKGADFHALLFERLRGMEVVPEEALQTLAVRRGEYALEVLKAAGAPEARIGQGAAAKNETEGREVMLKLEVGKAGG